MGQRYLLDTNICVYFLNQLLPPKAFQLVASAIDRGEAVLSVVTQMELLGFAFPSAAEEAITSQFVADLPILPLTDAIVAQTISIRRARKRKLPDAIIAATAVIHKLPLISKDTDFQNIAELMVVDPFQPIA